MEQIELVSPDLALSLRLDPYAPRAARYHVAQVDRPSPDLRDAVVQSQRIQLRQSTARY